jgi:alpha-L-rhamnosidase
MLEMGATTLWERWEYLAGMGMNSHNHVMFGSVDAWFYKTLCGLSPLESRWTSILARPYIPASLSSASASVDTPHGPVALAWRQDKQAIVMELQVPVGARLTLRLDRCPVCLSATLTPLGASSSTPIGQNSETLLEHGSYTVTLRLPAQA